MMTLELSNATDHPVTGNKAIRDAAELISADRFSRASLESQIDRIENTFDEREPEAVALYAHKLLKEALRLDEVRVDAVNRILDVIASRGLFVQPSAEVGEPIEGIQPAETYEAFLEANGIEAALERKAKLQAHGTNQHTSGGDNYHVLKEQGTSAEYLKARLQRDCPNADQLLANNRSVRAAAIEAGIIKPKPQLVLTKDPVASAKRIKEQRSEDWIDELIAELRPGLINPKSSAPELKRALVDGLGNRLPYLVSSLCRQVDGLMDEVKEVVINELVRDQDKIAQAGHGLADGQILGQAELAETINCSRGSLSGTLANAEHGNEILPTIGQKHGIRLLAHKVEGQHAKIQIKLNHV